MFNSLHYFPTFELRHHMQNGCLVEPSHFYSKIFMNLFSEIFKNFTRFPDEMQEAAKEVHGRQMMVEPNGSVKKPNIFFIFISFLI